jgi:hypothetical protein
LFHDKVPFLEESARPREDFFDTHQAARKVAGSARAFFAIGQCSATVHPVG